MAKAMSANDEIAALAQDLGATAGKIRSRRMFSGVGLFVGDAMFAVVINEALYFKVDKSNLSDYQAQQLAPLTFRRGDRDIEMSFREAPESTLDSADEFITWMRPALAAARRAATKRNRSRATKKKATTKSSATRKKLSKKKASKKTTRKTRAKKAARR